MKKIEIKNDHKDSSKHEEQKIHVVGRIWLFDGSMSEIQISIPFLGSCSDIYEKAAMFLKGYIQSLTQYWIRITHYQVLLRSRCLVSGDWIDQEYQKHEVPTNKVFVGKMDFGNWVDPTKLIAANN